MTTMTLLGIEHLGIRNVEQCDFAAKHGVTGHLWNVQHNGEAPIRMCTAHVAAYIETTAASIVELIPALLALESLDNRCGTALVNLVTRLLGDGGFDDLAVDLRTAWQATLNHVVDDDRRMRQARLLIGSVGFALMAPAPVDGDDDDCEAGR